MKFKARVRGIYSTAITKLLLDNEFEIVQPSPTIKKRFTLSQNSKPPDVDIYDRHNKQGLHVVGKSESLTALQAILLQRLPDVIFRKQSFPTDGVFKGVIKEDEESEQFVYVDVGSAVGKLPKKQVETNETDEVIVQVERRTTSTRQPLLSRKISTSGKYAVLIPEENVKVSLKIRDPQKRTSLIKFGKKIAPPKIGIIWRSSAADQPETILEREIDNLSNIHRKIFERAKQQKAPVLLWGSQYYMNVEFPALSKASLDEVRAKVTPTLNAHHYYKACGRKISATLETAEKMLENNVSLEEARLLFSQTITSEYPSEGSVISIEHVKPNGKVYYLGEARVEECGDETLQYSRTIKSEGFYDALGTPKEPGDRAITEAKIGGWHYTTKYFSENGVYKGGHVNFHTPLELYPRWIRYVDLEVDVCLFPDGVVQVLDDDELEKAVAKGFVSEKLAVLVKDELSNVLKKFGEASVSENSPPKE
ncbi:MAG: ribonuclease E/G [Candidatus Bathyarchaeia archaeon]